MKSSKVGSCFNSCLSSSKYSLPCCVCSGVNCLFSLSLNLDSKSSDVAAFGRGSSDITSTPAKSKIP